MKNTLVYFNGGNDYRTCEPLSRKDRETYDFLAGDCGHVGYLSGYKLSYKDNQYETETVVVYFKEQPNETEINRRKLNGFKAAKWHWIN